MQHEAGSMTVDRLYTSIYATPDGETHLRTVDVALGSADFAPPAEPLLVGELQAAAGSFFLAAPGGWGEADLARGIRHPTPRRQLGTLLRGEVVVHASDGTSVRLRPGDTLLFEDVAPAKGHTAVNSSAEQPCVLLMVQLAG